MATQEIHGRNRCLALGWVVRTGSCPGRGVDPSRRTLGKDLDSHRLRGRAGLVAQQMRVPVARIDEPLALPVDRGRALAVVALIGGDLALGHRDQAGTWMRMSTGGTARVEAVPDDIDVRVPLGLEPDLVRGEVVGLHVDLAKVAQGDLLGR